QVYYRLVFFFQAEDGIRDKLVTGVQTCALPIFIAAVSPAAIAPSRSTAMTEDVTNTDWSNRELMDTGRRRRSRDIQHVLDRVDRSEERRVGKECRFRGGGYR